MTENEKWCAENMILWGKQSKGSSQGWAIRNTLTRPYWSTHFSSKFDRVEWQPEDFLISFSYAVMDDFGFLVEVSMPLMEQECPS